MLPYAVKNGVTQQTRFESATSFGYSGLWDEWQEIISRPNSIARACIVKTLTRTVVKLGLLHSSENFEDSLEVVNAH